MKKKILSLLLVAMACVTLAVPALAMDSDFNISEDGILYSYSGPGGDVIIPDSVTQIGHPELLVGAFQGCKRLTSVTIPDSVTVIWRTAFAGCTGLTSVIIPDSVSEIGVYAFSGCTSLTNVTIGNGVPKIRATTFHGCKSLTSVTIPDSVGQIDSDAFEDCPDLTIYGAVGSCAEQYAKKYGIPFVASMPAPAFPGFSITKYGVLSGYIGSDRDVVIPASVTEIGDSAFAWRGSLAASIIIPDSVTRIGESAFAGCHDLTSVTIGNEVTEIGNRAFSSCESLTGVTIPDSVTKIEWGTFSNCDSLTSVTIPDSVTSIGGEAFRGCTGLTGVTIPDSVTEIGDSAFENCPNLTIYGVVGSYAETYAKENKIPFVAGPAPVVEPTVPIIPNTAYTSTQMVDIDGVPVEFQCYALKDANGNDTNYVKLRDVAYVLNGTSAQFEVGWDGQVSITTGTAYTPNGSEMKTPYSGDRTYTSAGISSVSLNGSSEAMQSLLLTDAEGNGYTYFKLRDLGAALGFKVDWTADRGIFVETK